MPISEKDEERISKEALEEGTFFAVDFTKMRLVASQVFGVNTSAGTDVIPVVVQDADSKEVLVVAYTNRAAFENTFKSGNVTFWSTSRNKFWIKGESSGNFLKFVEAWVNCEQNSLLYLARTETGVCHTNDDEGKPRHSCYYRKIIFGAGGDLRLVKHPGVWY